MRTELLDYELPDASIARYPMADRDGARMLVVNDGGVCHLTVSAWPRLLARGALVVLNDTRVFKARLLGSRYPTGGRVELLLLTQAVSEPNSAARQTWWAIGRANRPIVPGMIIEFQSLLARVVERLAGGELLVVLESSEPIEAVIDRIGHIPIPPYLRREAEPSDLERYQTIFASRLGSIAAPTAGLHISHVVLNALSQEGIFVEYCTLHVGIGTFRSVIVDDLDTHAMHSEQFEVSPALSGAIDAARERDAPVVAVGTTVVRALESAADPSRPGYVVAQKGTTSLLIQPGFSFKVVDGLLTNFHMPRSTLLALVGAFVGLERTLAAYHIAIQHNYRFLSYGDAMWIPARV